MQMERFLEELRAPDKPIPAARLAHLSDPTPEQVRVFEEAWPTVSTDRRRKVASMLADLAEDNVELDFSAVFRRMLADEDEEVRIAALGGLWECEERSVIRPLIRLLTFDPEQRVRAAAAQTLGRFALLAETGKLLERDANRVADALLYTLDNEDESPEVRRRAIEAIAPMSLERVPELIQEAYEDGDAQLRAGALFAMGRTCDPRWVPVLLEELEDEDPEMRYEAVTALGEIGSEDAVPRLIPLIHDPDAQVQAAAVAALGEIGGDAAKNALSHMAKDPESGVSDLADAALETAELEDEPLGLPRRLRPE